jgi:hydrogenase maturation protease
MPIRLLGLGNDILGDDAFGLLVAEQVRQLLPDEVEVIGSSAGGFHLMDDVLGASRLIVVDAVLTGAAEPGTVYVLREEDVQTFPGGSPHYVGLLEAIALGRKLSLSAPQEVVIVAVEAADCLTVGGAMHPAVQANLPIVVNLVQQVVWEWQRDEKTVVVSDAMRERNGSHG